MINRSNFTDCRPFSRRAGSKRSALFFDVCSASKRRQKEKRSFTDSSDHADCAARFARVLKNDNFVKHSYRYYARGEEKPLHMAPKRFSLIDFEGPRAANSTGMHRNATPLNSSAMERLRCLSAPTSPSSPSRQSPARG